MMSALPLDGPSFGYHTYDTPVSPAGPAAQRHITAVSICTVILGAVVVAAMLLSSSVGHAWGLGPSALPQAAFRWISVAASPQMVATPRIASALRRAGTSAAPLIARPPEGPPSAGLPLNVVSDRSLGDAGVVPPTKGEQDSIPTSFYRDASGVLPLNKGLTPLLTKTEFQALLDARAQHRATCTISPDLGMSQQTAELYEEGFGWNSRRMVRWDSVEKVVDKPGCYLVQGGDGDWSWTLEKVSLFSDTTNRAASLLPTDDGPPTAVLGGFSMHRFGKGVNPLEDTRRKLLPLGPLLHRNVRSLDVCTGLGYTAIAAAQAGADVTTIELDPTMQELCALNPWSQGLYKDPTGPRVTQLMGDATEVIKTLPSDEYQVVVHDPPTSSLGGALFSREFYKELLRVLKPGGILYHYIGDPDSKSGGRDTAAVGKRLKEAGFRMVIGAPMAHGLVAAPEKMPKAVLTLANRRPAGQPKQRRVPKHGLQWEQQLQREKELWVEEWGSSDGEWGSWGY